MNKSTVKLSFILLSIFIVFTAFTYAVKQQIYYTKTGHISFFSSTPVEDIKAENHNVTGAIEAESGKMQFVVLMTAFNFEKALMQEHFNENYMESTKYPKAKFNGLITNNSAIDYTKDGVYKAIVEGDLTIKDKTNKVKTTGTIEVKANKLLGKAKFTVKLDDYNIDRPKIVIKSIAEEIDITVDMTYTKK